MIGQLTFCSAPLKSSSIRHHAINNSTAIDNSWFPTPLPAAYSLVSLSGRPREHPPTKQVQMQMVHCLAAILACSRQWVADSEVLARAISAAAHSRSASGARFLPDQPR